jgi:hypothetical protein
LLAVLASNKTMLASGTIACALCTSNDSSRSQSPTEEKVDGPDGRALERRRRQPKAFAGPQGPRRRARRRPIEEEGRHRARFAVADVGLEPGISFQFLKEPESGVKPTSFQPPLLASKSPMQRTDLTACWPGRSSCGQRTVSGNGNSDKFGEPPIRYQLRLEADSLVAPPPPHSGFRFFPRQALRRRGPRHHLQHHAISTVYSYGIWPSSRSFWP